MWYIDNLVGEYLPGCNSTYRLRYWNDTILIPPIPASFATLQQHLPFTVLKLANTVRDIPSKDWVATAPTDYGIETVQKMKTYWRIYSLCCNSTYRLRYWNLIPIDKLRQSSNKLQQHLPFTVLKPFCRQLLDLTCNTVFVATALTVYGIETQQW